MKRRFLVNPSGRRALRRNRMARPTAGYRRADEKRWAREWGSGISVREAAKIYDAAMATGTPAWLRPPAAAEKLPAPYGREQARREYLAARRAPLREARGLRELGFNAPGRYRVQRRRFSTLEAARTYANTHFARTGVVLAIEAIPPKRRRGKTARNSAHLEARNMARRRSRSRRRKSSSARRPRRRAVARVTRSNSPKRRRASARRMTARRYRRNPPVRFGRGFLGRLMGALVDGLTVTGGVVAQNAIARYVPSLIPATVPQAALLNGITKDVLGIVAGSWGAHQFLGAERARFVVAGQAHAAIARVIRAANIPQVSTLMGEYDPIRLGTYTRGIAPPASRAALPAGNGAMPGNVRALKNVGVYTDGVSFAPSLY